MSDVALDWSVQPTSDDLKATLVDLDAVIDEAREEDYPEPSATALENARCLLPKVYSLRPCRFEVSPTADGDVLIYVRTPRQRSVIILCDSRGGALCSVDLDGQHRCAEYDSIATLPDGFVREALGDLGR